MGSVCDCFENSKDVGFEIEQATKINLPTQKGLRCVFSPYLDVVILPLIGKKPPSLDVKGRAWVNRIVIEGNL